MEKLSQRGLTLWETVCSLAGESNDGSFSLARALNTAAAGPEIAKTEVNRLLQEGLLEQTGRDGYLRLTDSGKLSCSDIHNTGLVDSPPSPPDEFDREIHS